jgi:hypothetical protein
MNRQCAIIDFFSYVTFAQQLIDWPNGFRRGTYSVEQQFSRKSFSGEKSQFWWKSRRKKVGPLMAGESGPIV